MSVRIRGRTVLLDNDKTVELDGEIAECIEFDDVAVVRLLVPHGQTKNENILGVELRTGRLLWKIARRKYVYADSPYTSLWREGLFLWAHNWDGSDAKVDPRTGKVIEVKDSW